MSKDKSYTPDKKISLKLLFNESTSDYSLFFSYKKNFPTSLILGNDKIGWEALAEIRKRFQTIKFTSLASLIEFCKSEKIDNLQIVFEWMNMFIYKEERKVFSQFFNENESIIGISNMMESVLQEIEEMSNVNGFKVYQSELRSLIIKSLIHLSSSLDSFKKEKNVDSFLSKLMFSVFLLNFDEAAKNIKEVIQQSKELKVIFILK
jgi:hypothetical protein